MNHPYPWLDRDHRGRTLAAAIALSLVVGAALSTLDAPLRSEAAPYGIVSFEFAGDPETAAEIVASWDERARIHAGLIQGLDYLYLFAYGLSLSLACALLGERLGGGAARVGAVLAWGMLFAAVLDAIENAALIAILVGPPDDRWPAIAALCAAPKFALVFAALAFVLVGTPWALVARRTTR